MDKALLLGVASILITLFAGFGAVSRRLGVLEQRIDLMWKWFEATVIAARIGGRRFGDPPSAKKG